LLVIIYKGEVVAATAGRAENVADAFQAELMAAVHALRLAEHLGAIYVILEMDSHLLMLALNRIIEVKLMHPPRP
jgi:ribonuclease HI